MTLLAKLAPGVHLYDHRTGQERLVDKVEVFNQVLFLSFRHPSTGEIERQPFPLMELESRFELLTAEAVALLGQARDCLVGGRGSSPAPRLLFNGLFATQTSLIDLLPHQLGAVYGRAYRRHDGERGVGEVQRYAALSRT